MKKVIVGIHGLGNKPPKAILQDWWLKSIREGLDKINKERVSVPFELVYWADITNAKPLDLSVNDKENPLFIDEVYKKGNQTRVKKQTSLKVKIIKYIEEQIDKIFLNDDLSINFKDVTDKLIHHYFKELEIYYREDCKSITNPECNVKKDIQDRLKLILKKYKGYQILLISHSMGSIVAFDVLSDIENVKPIDTFVTIGSPLGIPVIVSRIFAEQKNKNRDIQKPSAPDNILKSWYNMSDMEDKVALDHTLNDDFDPNKNGVSAIDVTVVNNYEMNNEENHHKSFGYLRTTEMANIIHKFLTVKKRDRIYQRYCLVIDKIKSVFKRRSK